MKEHKEYMEDGLTTYKGRILTQEEIERKKSIVLSTRLFVFGKEHLGLSYEEVYHFLVDCLQDMEFPSMCLAAAKWIARQSAIGYLNELMLTKIVLRAHRKKYPINHIETATETATARRCSKCRQWKLHAAFSETSKLCRVCKREYDKPRKR